MTVYKTEKKKVHEPENKRNLNPDPETLQKTDPQDNMKGPVSSLMQTIKEGAEDEITKEEADKRKKENM